MSSQKSQFAGIEEEVLAQWQKEGTFAKSTQNRKNGPVFSFYDGPPFANGLPHFGHSLVTSIKDSLGRYKTMRGYYVERRNGWDCHGLPVEFAIEKQFGVSGKKQILELGLDKFNAACRASVFEYKDEWEQFFDRIGRWTDTKNAYATIDHSYTESVWWVLSEIHKKGLLYKGYKSMPYCPRCETPLSNFEVNEGYKDNVPDPSLFVKFKLIEEKERWQAGTAQGASEDRKGAVQESTVSANRSLQHSDVPVSGSGVSSSAGDHADTLPTFLLGWTTTPWSLPGNAAIAVNPNEQYVYVKHGAEGKQEVLILAKKRLSVLDEKDYQVVKEVNGKELVGLSYEPLFNLSGLDKHENPENLYRVWPADFVSIEDGTGVLHVAPAFGEDDLSLGEAHGLPVLSTVNNGGQIQSGIGLKTVEGLFFKEADRPIIEHLTQNNRVFAAETANHTYPFCYRCDSPLLYYAISTWFIKVSDIRTQLLKTADDIAWSPSHIKKGRFGKWLEGARDWAISRNRYWGAPMPVWVNEEDENDFIVVGSIQELKELAGKDADLVDLHRPFIDKVSFTKDGKTYRRVEEVLDCWFESGSMPVAQQHYPFENKDEFDASFPADYIGEGLDQTRLWFYVLHVISTILFNKPAYKNVLVNGMVLAADGEKLSKRLKNYPPVDDVFSNEGADSLRLYLLSNNQAVAADYMRFNRDAMKDLNRNVLGTLLNSYRFFKMYADIDKWKPAKELKQPKPSNVLDKWILARLNSVIEETTKQADAYKLAAAISPVFDLIDDTSNWYIRRSRRRFWKSEDDTDKKQAYEVLHYVLTSTCQLLAPWAPFISDHIYQNLAKGTNFEGSVHLSDWPAGQNINKPLIDEMAKAREYINQGLAQRAEAGVKVRQPLASVSIPKISKDLTIIVQDELNVKETNFSKGNSVRINTGITEELKIEGLMRDIVRQVQNARKQANLEVDNHIYLQIESKDGSINQAIKTHADTIKHETLAKELELKGKADFTTTVKLEGQEVTIRLSKV